MNVLNKLSLITLIVACGLFFSSYYYLQRFNQHDLRYSEAIASVTTSFSIGSPATSEPAYTSKSYVITEERSVLIAMLVSVALCLFSIVFNYAGGFLFRYSKFELQLNFASVIVSGCVLYTIVDSGLHTYV